MRLVFIVTSFWACGELNIAEQFAEKCSKNNKCLFLIPPSHKNLINKKFKFVTWIPNSRTINKIIINEIKSTFKPDLIILSDFLNFAFAEKHYGVIREDLELFSCPLATFDIYDWDTRRKCMDTYGFPSNIPKNISINDYGSKIIPCPLGNPNINRQNEFRFALSRKISLLDANLKKELKSELLGTNKTDQNIILISNAKWQNQYLKHKDVKNFIDLANKYFESLILELSKNNLIIIIGDTPNFLSESPNILIKNSMHKSCFDKYVSISDLYLGRNITSTSMVEIALSKIPCVNLVNSLQFLSLDTPHIFENNIRMYKFMMFPVGWFDFLTPLFKNNPYYELLTTCELFDINSTLKNINDILFNPNRKDDITQKVDILQKQLALLDDPNLIINNILSRTDTNYDFKY